MRLDQFVSRIGIIKRRTVAKEMADNGLIKKNGSRCKAGGDIKPGDIISIGGNKPITIEVMAVPAGNVKKEDRENYYKPID